MFILSHVREKNEGEETCNGNRVNFSDEERVFRSWKALIGLVELVNCVGKH